MSGLEVSVIYLLGEDFLCEDSLHFTEGAGLDGDLAGGQMGRKMFISATSVRATPRRLLAGGGSGSSPGLLPHEAGG